MTRLCQVMLIRSAEEDRKTQKIKKNVGFYKTVRDVHKFSTKARLSVNKETYNPCRGDTAL